MEYTENELAMLSEEEQKILKEDEAEVQEPETNSEIPNFKDEEKKEEVKEEEPEPKSEVKEEVKEEEPEPKSEVKEEEKKEEIIFKKDTLFKLDHAAKADDCDNKIKELGKNLEEGAIELKDYILKRDDLLREKFKKEMYEDINRQVEVQTAQRVWRQSQEDFFTENPIYFQNQAVNAAFSFMVNEMIKRPEAEKMSDRAILLAAKKSVEESLGNFNLPEKKIEKKEEVKKDTDKKVNDAKQKIKEEEAKNIKTISKVPAAGTTVENRFDHLDSLKGQELELALSKLSVKEQKEYENYR